MFDQDNINFALYPVNDNYLNVIENLFQNNFSSSKNEKSRVFVGFYCEIWTILDEMKYWFESLYNDSMIDLKCTFIKLYACVWLKFYS